MAHISGWRRTLVLGIASLTVMAIALVLRSFSITAGKRQNCLTHDMTLSGNSPPPFDPTVTKDVLVQVYREICTNYVKEAAFLFARKIMVGYSERALFAVWDEMGEDCCETNVVAAQRLEMERFQGIVHDEAIKECQKSRYRDELKCFERNIKLFDEGRYQPNTIDDYDEEWGREYFWSYDENLGTNKAFWLAVVARTLNIREMGLSCGHIFPPIESEAREKMKGSKCSS